MARPPSDDDFADLVHRCWPGLYRTAYLMLGERAAAEDLVQTALASTYAQWRKVRSLDAAPAYARTVLAHTAASWFRRKGWRNERPTEVLPEPGAAHDVPDPTDRPALMTALAQLAPRQRAVVVLRYYDDLSVAETAEALGIAPGTVKSQTSDALDRLRTLLGDDLADIGSTGPGGAARDTTGDSRG